MKGLRLSVVERRKFAFLATALGEGLADHASLVEKTRCKAFASGLQFRPIEQVACGLEGPDSICTCGCVRQHLSQFGVEDLGSAGLGRKLAGLLHKVREGSFVDGAVLSHAWNPLAAHEDTVRDFRRCFE